MSVKRFVAPIAGGVLAAAAAFGSTAVSPVGPIANAAGTWAAIAISPENEISGAGWTDGAATQAEAESIALNNCASAGNTQCQIAISAYSGCIAVADSPDSWASGAGSTVEDAESVALSNTGGGTILASGCTGF